MSDRMGALAGVVTSLILIVWAGRLGMIDARLKCGLSNHLHVEMPEGVMIKPGHTAYCLMTRENLEPPSVIDTVL